MTTIGPAKGTDEPAEVEWARRMVAGGRASVDLRPGTTPPSA